MKSLIFIFFIVVFLFSSCKVLRVNDVSLRRNMHYTEAVRQKFITSARPEHLLISNADLSISAENQTNMKITIYVKKDEFIFVSGKLLGFEIFRFMLSEDSIKFINRVQRNYYFGSIEDVNNNSLKVLSLEEIQEIIYTGLVKEEGFSRKYIERKFQPDIDHISYTRVVDEGKKIDLEYDLSVFLKKILFTDHVNSIYINMDIEREGNMFDGIEGSYLKNNYRIGWEFRNNGIRFVPYTRIQFKIGKNYNEVQGIL